MEKQNTPESLIAEALKEKGKTLAIAESCTGGLLASRLCDVPGSSAYMIQAVVAYADEAKVRELGVSAEDLELCGAVSEPVARQMAEGVRRRAGADLGVATTGIAGPSGGTAEKPVGTLWLALADADGTHVQRYQLMRDRTRNRELAVHVALEWIRRRILGPHASAG